MEDKVIIPCDSGNVSDGYHTFNELYRHRHMLFIALMKHRKDSAWWSPLHDDGTAMEGWFVAGVQTEQGSITYHLPNELQPLVGRSAGIKRLDKAPPWDGHTSNDVINRLIGDILYGA